MQQKITAKVWIQIYTRQKIFSEKKFINMFNWVDSTISYVGEPFLWLDGSNVFGLNSFEPNNAYGNSSFLNENALAILNKKLYDFSKSYNFGVVCQI